MSNMEKPFVEIADLMSRYFNGLYHVNTTKLNGVFHPDARYINMVEGNYTNKSLIEYFELLNKRISPAENSELFEYRVDSIELGGKRMAIVKASMTMMRREYCDFLTLTCDHLGWRIMSKVFTYKVNG